MYRAAAPFVSRTAVVKLRRNKSESRYSQRHAQKTLRLMYAPFVVLHAGCQNALDALLESPGSSAPVMSRDALSAIYSLSCFFL